MLEFAPAPIFVYTISNSRLSACVYTVLDIGGASAWGHKRYDRAQTFVLGFEEAVRQAGVGEPIKIAPAWHDLMRSFPNVSNPYGSNLMTYLHHI